MWQSWMGWKMPLCKWHTFWMSPYLTCYFIVILFCIEKKLHLMRNLATILPLKSKLSAKFQRFNAIDGSIKMLWKVVEFQNNSIKTTNCKTLYTRTKQWPALRKLFSLPPTYPHHIKPYYVFGTNIFLRK